MKIIYYSPHPTHDIVSEVGYATHQREVINALKELGNEVFPVIMGGTDASSLNPVANHQYKVPTWKRILKLLMPRFLWTSFNNFKLRKHDALAAQKLETEIQKVQPDLIYERSEYLQDSGALLASKYKIKYFLEVNAPFVEEMRSFEGYSLYESKAHTIEAFKLSKADKVIAVSTALGEFLVNKYQCDSSKLFIQPNCINPEKISLDKENLSKVEKLIKNGDNNIKVIGFVGSMFPYHGVDILMDAFSMVSKGRNDLKLMIVGDGIIMADIKLQAKSLKIEDKVIFTGKIPHSHVFDYISNMDICIMAKSNWYGSPVKLFEYGLMEKPIIAPNTSPVRDVMENEKDALVIQDNVNALSEAIEKLLNEPHFASKLALTFHNKVLEHYTWQHAAKNIMELCG